MPLAHFGLRPWPVLAVLALLSLAPTAHALSKRDTEKVAALDARMAAAEKRYRDALVLVNNSDPKGTAEGDAALEDMEDVIDACIKQRGCLVANQLSTYKRLLKARADAEAPASDEPEDDDTLLQADPDHIGPLATDVPAAARTASLLNDQQHDFDKMVQYNPAVQAGIRRWLTDMRPSLLTSYENYANLRAVMWPEWQKRALPEALLFGIMAKESNGKVHASSRAGAAGLMQFMPATGAASDWARTVPVSIPASMRAVLPRPAPPISTSAWWGSTAALNSPWRRTTVAKGARHASLPSPVAAGSGSRTSTTSSRLKPRTTCRW